MTRDPMVMMVMMMLRNDAARDSISGSQLLLILTWIGWDGREEAGED